MQWVWTDISTQWKAGGSGSSGSCAYDWIFTLPSGHISWTTCEDFKNEFFASTPPTVNIRWTDYVFGIYEVWRTLTTPLIEWRWALWANPPGTLTSLDISVIGFTQANPTPWTRYGTNDANVTITLWTTVTYTATISDDQWRSANASGSYVGVYPYFVGVASHWDIVDGMSESALVALAGVNKIVKAQSTTAVTTTPTAERYVHLFPAGYTDLSSILDNSSFETITDYNHTTIGIVMMDGSTQQYDFYELKNDTTQGAPFTNTFIH